MRKLKSLDEIKYSFSSFNIENSEVRQPQIIDNFYHEEYIGVTGETYSVFHDDIYMLFNQNRLSRILSPNDLVAYINSLDKSTHTLPKMTDEQLFQFIKSRHIQSPAELLAWSQYLNDNYSEIISEIEGGVDNAETSSVAEGADSNGSEGSN